jgi:hypothetical protein
MSGEEGPLLVSRAGLRRVAGLRLPGAQLATFLALLAHLDDSGQAQITQPELCQLLGTGPGRVWQSLQALVAAGVLHPPAKRAGKGRRTPYGVPAGIAVTTAAQPPLPIPPLRKRTSAP